MWSGFSSEIETLFWEWQPESHSSRMWSGFSSEIETCRFGCNKERRTSRMWSGFSSEIETKRIGSCERLQCRVACGAASRLRLKPSYKNVKPHSWHCRMWSGFSSEIETQIWKLLPHLPHTSHVERLLV